MSEVCVDLEVASVLWLFSQLKQLLATELSGASGLASVVVAPGLMYSMLCLRFFLRQCPSSQSHPHG